MSGHSFLYWCRAPLVIPPGSRLFRQWQQSQPKIAQERRSITEKSHVDAAMVIQKHIRGYRARQLLQSEGELRMGGMIHGEIQRIVNEELQTMDRDEALQKLKEKINESKNRRIGYQNCSPFLMFTILLFHHSQADDLPRSLCTAYIHSEQAGP